MKTRRLSPIVLACAAAIGLLSASAHAQIGMNLTDSGSLTNGMSAQGARSFQAPKSATQTTGAGYSASSPSGTVGTSGTGAGAGYGTAIGGSSGLNGASTTQYTYNAAGQLIQSATGVGSGVINQVTGLGNVIAGTGGTTGSGIGGALENVDWLKVIQVAAPVAAGLTGNSKIGQIASIAGSGAQIYGQVSSGQELSWQNYANMGNIALQTAAAVTNNTNIDKAAQLSNLGTGAWNAYGVVTGSGAAANQGTPQLVGYTAEGQPVYQSTGAAANTGTNWGAMAQVVSTTAPQLGNITGNQNLGQAGQLLGVASNVYGQTNGGTSLPSWGQAAGAASQIGYATGTQGLQQASQVGYAAGQIQTIYDASGRPVGTTTGQQQVAQQPAMTFSMDTATRALGDIGSSASQTVSQGVSSLGSALGFSSGASSPTIQLQYDDEGYPMPQVQKDPGLISGATATKLVNKAISKTDIGSWFK